MIKRSLVFGGGALGIMLILPLGGLIKNPWAEGDESPLWVSGWTPSYPGETIYLRRYTGRVDDIVLVRPEDLDAGAMETVFPFRESERGNEEELAHALEGDAVGMLGDDDPRVSRVVLMRDAVVKGLKDDALVVFGEFQRDHLARWQQRESDVADALIEQRGGEQERRTKMLVSQFRSFEFPRHLRNGRAEVVDTFRIT